MKLKVEAVSAYGFKVGSVWYSKDKDSQAVVTGLTKGDEVEVEVKNDRFVTSIKKLSSGTNNQSASTSTQTSQQRATVGTTRQSDPQTRLEIARGTAVKATMQSPTMASQLNETDISEALSILKDTIQSLTSYILTGDFTVLSPQENKTETK